MSELNQSTTRTVGPAQAPGTASGDSAAAEVYRRAVQARPTGFRQDPIGAMAQAMDRLGRAAGKAVARTPLEGRDGLADAEQRLKRAMEAVRTNPASVSARQGALTAALALLRDMAHLPANDPRRVKVALFIVRLANELGARGIPFNQPGLDVRGLLRLAAMTASRYGGPAEMQAAFTLEGLLKASMPQSSVDAVRLRDALMQRFGLSKEAQQLLLNNWAVRLTAPGEVPRVDVSARTISIDAAQENPSLGALARAFWHDTTLRSPTSRDGFVEAFLKVASQTGFALLGRKYREVRSMARRELQHLRIAVLGARDAAPATTGGRVVDESSDMFAALAVFSRGQGLDQLPPELAEAMERFYG